MSISILRNLKYLSKYSGQKLTHSPCLFAVTKRLFASKPIDEDDKPVKFSTSGAIYGLSDRRPIQDDTPWYQGIVISVSMAAFLIYFCAIREESDIDIELDRSLYDRVGGLEIINLQTARRFYLEQGDSSEVSKIDKRLKELNAPSKPN